MVRFAAFCFAMIMLVSAHPAMAQRTIFLDFAGLTTADPNHKGYGVDQDDHYVPVQWEKIAADCPECETLATVYNQTMQSLMNTRYWIVEIEERNQEIEKLIHDKRSQDQRGMPQELLSEPEEKYATEKMTYLMGLEDMTARLPALNAQEESLLSLSQDLRAQLENCERNICPLQSSETIPVVVKKTDVVNSLPFDWKGPYPSNCETCAQHADHLNELPTRTRQALAGLEAARADLMFAEIELLSLQAEHEAIALNAVEGYIAAHDGALPSEDVGVDLQNAYHKKVNKRLAERERALTKAEQDIAKFETDLDALEDDFAQSLTLYNDCVLTCEPQAGSASLQGLPSGDVNLPVTLPPENAAEIYGPPVPSKP